MPTFHVLLKGAKRLTEQLSLAAQRGSPTCSYWSLLRTRKQSEGPQISVGCAIKSSPPAGSDFWGGTYGVKLLYLKMNTNDHSEGSFSISMAFPIQLLINMTCFDLRYLITLINQKGYLKKTKTKKKYKVKIITALYSQDLQNIV